MHAPAPTRHKKAWQEKLTRSGYFFGAVLLHLVAFLLVSTLVIWRPAPPPPIPFEPVSPSLIKPPPPPPPTPSASGSSASNPQMDPQSVVVPPPALLSTITTVNSNAFTTETNTKLNDAMAHLSADLAKGSGLGPSGSSSGERGGGSNPFGIPDEDGQSTGLQGTFYDLKQTKDRQPTGMTPEQWRTIVTNFIAQDWDDSLLEPYYKSRTPIATNSYAISPRMSEEAPKAFRLEQEVQPGLWVIHYHAKVVAPSEGDYRLVGFGDDLMEVKIKGSLVLDGGWISLSSSPNLHVALPNVWSPTYGSSEGLDHVAGMGHTNGLLKMGASFHMETAEAVDMDVLIGDQGGFCSFFLMIEKEGNTYEKLPDGTPKLPFFQLGNGAIPTFSGGEEVPPYSATPEPWQGAGG